METNHGNAAKVGCQSVSGTTILSGKRPTESRLTMTAGLSLRISAPMEGSNRTIQISPRCGRGAVAMQVVLAERFEVREARLASIVTLGQCRRTCQNIVSLSGRQPAQFVRCPITLRTS